MSGPFSPRQHEIARERGAAADAPPRSDAEPAAERQAVLP